MVLASEIQDLSTNYLSPVNNILNNVNYTIIFSLTESLLMYLAPKKGETDMKPKLNHSFFSIYASATKNYNIPS